MANYIIVKNLPKNVVKSTFFEGQSENDRFWYEEMHRPSGEVVFYRYKKIKP